MILAPLLLVHKRFVYFRIFFSNMLYSLHRVTYLCHFPSWTPPSGDFE
jgi:hypothetical protein